VSKGLRQVASKKGTSVRKSTYRILTGDAIEQLRTLPDKSVQCVVTSPPYYALRNYGVSGQIGLEDTPQEYVARLVEVFREVWRVLRDDGTVFLNLGDSYAGGNCRGGGIETASEKQRSNFGTTDFMATKANIPPGLKPKDMMGIPWRVAFALQDDGWWLRSDIIWSKANPMPESVTDRPTKSHEYIFLLTKSARYYWDQEAVKEDGVVEAGSRRTIGKAKENSTTRAEAAGRLPSGNEKIGYVIVNGTRNIRTVWDLSLINNSEPTRP